MSLLSFSKDSLYCFLALFISIANYPYVPAQVILRKKKVFDEEIERRGWTEKIYVDNAKILLGG